MAIDLRQIAKALDAAGTEPPAPTRPKKPHLSMGRAVLLGAGLMTAGRLVAGPKARGMLESVQSRIEDSDWYRELQTELGGGRDDEPEAEAGEAFDDEEPYEDQDEPEDDEYEPEAEYDDRDDDDEEYAEDDEDQYPGDEYEGDEDFEDDDQTQPASDSEEDFDDEDEEDFDDEDDRPERPRSRRGTRAKQRSRA